ncbi:DUF6691 family protein [Haliangium sp.]|uniref:DUF6691 family protein n=1 Tax=Haliangium sp. TaxID=2663208 RepID=UPI003D139D2F
MRNLIAFASGLIFAVGLALSGMTQPAKVIGFLDFFGHWDASLMFVMIGAIGVYMPLYRLITRRSAPVFAASFSLPTRRDIDRRLVLGALLFGVGWGLAGYCPGPGLASLSTAAAEPLTFVGAMVAGMLVFAAFERLRPAQTTPA